MNKHERLNDLATNRPNSEILAEEWRRREHEYQELRRPSRYLPEGTAE